MFLSLLLLVVSFVPLSDFLPEMRRRSRDSTMMLSGNSVDCPRTCLCNALSRIVYCSRRGMTSLPHLLPVGTTQLNVNGNAFAATALRRANFSGYGDATLEHLYMSECGLEELDAGTFEDLVGLKWLDVSNNRLRTIAKDTFRGLSLEHLFLNGNRQLQIFPDSFGGMTTVGLYLHDCHLASLVSEAFVPLRPELRYLWLNGNQLERVDRGMLETFLHLQHLRLGSNPLLCNCDVIWLKEFYDSNEEIFRGALSPACLWPPKLKSKRFSELDVDSFRCRVPMFSRVEAFFNDSQMRLNCRATGDPAPSLYWIQPSGSASRYSPPSDLEIQENEGVLVVGEQGARQRGMYICIANNDAGNVTLTIDIPNPAAASPPGSVHSPHGTSRSFATRSAIEEEEDSTGSAVVSLQLITPAWAEEGTASTSRHHLDTGWGKHWHDLGLGVRSTLTANPVSLTSSQNFHSSVVLRSVAAAAAAADTVRDHVTMLWSEEEGAAWRLNTPGVEAPSSASSDSVPLLQTTDSSKTFSLTELLVTVLVTHVCTVIGCLATSWLCCRRGFRDKREGVAIGTVRDSGKRSPEFAYWGGVAVDNGQLRFVDYLNHVSPIRR